MRRKQSSSDYLISGKDHTSAAMTQLGIACQRWFGWRSRCVATACVMAGSLPPRSSITSSPSHRLPTCGSSGQTCKRCAHRVTPARRKPNRNNGMAFLRCHWHGDSDQPLACHYFIRNRGGSRNRCPRRITVLGSCLHACLSIFEMKLDRYHDILSGEASGRWHGVRSVAKFAQLTCERK